MDLILLIGDSDFYFPVVWGMVGPGNDVLYNLVLGHPVNLDNTRA